MEDDDEGDEYQSDGGTVYVKEPMSGTWVDEKDLPPQVRAERTKKTKERAAKDKRGGGKKGVGGGGGASCRGGWGRGGGE